MQFVEVNKAAKLWAKYLQQQSRSRLTKGKSNVSRDLYNSIKGDYIKDQSPKILFKMLDYGKFLDKGVRGKIASPIGTALSPYRFKNSMPPPETIAEWAKKRNIRFRNEDGTFAKGNYASIGFVIARSIRNKGIEARLFFTRTLDLSYKYIMPKLALAVGKDIATQIKKIAKETEKENKIANKKIKK